MHPLYTKAHELSFKVIGAAIEVHRHKGPGLLESIYERCLMRELELLNISATSQLSVEVEYKGLVFDTPLKLDVFVDSCLIVENKVIEQILPVHKAQLLSYMKLLNAPLGLLINYHEPVLKNGICRLILDGAERS
jgi:GxxExxY protein